MVQEAQVMEWEPLGMALLDMVVPGVMVQDMGPVCLDMVQAMDPVMVLDMVQGWEEVTDRGTASDL